MGIRLRRVGAWGLGLAVFYAVFVRFYQAAGGRIGLPDRVAALDGFQRAGILAGVLILVGGVACVVLTSRWIRRFPRPLVLAGVAAPAVVGGWFALAHGLAGLVANALELAGVITMDKPLLADPTPAARAADAWWNLTLYQPWFVAMGASLLLAAVVYGRAAGLSARTVRRAAIGVLLATVALAGSMVAAIVLGVRVAAG